MYAGNFNIRSHFEGWITKLNIDTFYILKEQNIAEQMKKKLQILNI